MRPRILIALVALVFVPAAARAALTVHIEQKQVAPAAEDQIVYLDAYLEDPNNQNESLSLFRLFIDGPANTAGGVRFEPPKTFGIPRSSAAHPYVFFIPNVFNNPNNLAGTTFDRLGSGWGESLDVDVSPARNGLIAIPVRIPAGTPAGVYPFVLDAGNTVLSRTNSFTPDPIPFVVGQPGSITVTPEPASVALTALPALLMFRRRGR